MGEGGACRGNCRVRGGKKKRTLRACPNAREKEECVSARESRVSTRTARQWEGTAQNSSRVAASTCDQPARVTRHM
eukprot:354869-Chlamydomonas_euryale.AAC.2